MGGKVRLVRLTAVVPALAMLGLAARTLAIAIVYPAVGAILDRSLVAALVFAGGLGLAAAIFARAPGSLFEEGPTGS